MDNSNLKAGTKIRVTFEGEVEPTYSPGRLDFLTTTGRKHHSAWLDEEAVTIEVIRPEIKAGQVWRAEGRHYFARKGEFAPSRLYMTGANGYGLYADAFHVRYPDAKLVFDPEA